MSRLTVVGAGYVGLVTAACMAELGHDVVAMDVDADKIELLREGGRPHLRAGAGRADRRQPGAHRVHHRPGAAPTPRASSSSSASTRPATYSGDADLSRIWQALDNLPPDDGDHVLVTKSTVPVGTGAPVQAELAQRGLRAHPLRLQPRVPARGHGHRATSCTPTAWSSAPTSPGWPSRWPRSTQGIDCPVLTTDVASAEMIKYASNAFLATKISFINEIANVCEATGADVTVVAQGMGLDTRIGPHFLQAGIGYGGSCFPKDVSALKQIAGNSGYHFQLLNAVIEVNELQKRRVIGKLKRHLGDELRGKTHRPPGPGVQAQHRRHPPGLVHRPGQPAHGRGRPGGRLRPGGHGRTCGPSSPR